MSNSATLPLFPSQQFCPSGMDPFDTVGWTRRDARITGEGGVVFEQRGVEAPTTWSDSAVNICASKYLAGKLGSPARETSFRQMIERVASRYAEAGVEQGYFDAETAKVFQNDLTWLLLHQYVSFNSPVWFNVGVRGKGKEQVSACYIVSVDDNMPSIMNLAAIEAMIFKYGSGAGSNLSNIRSSREGISGGGKASGPLSFMEIYDRTAKAIKSGGVTRRAAKMQILDIDHGDILDFVRCKSREEKKAKALLKAGFGGGMDGEAYGSVFYQNSNLSVRIFDEFMEAYEKRGKFWTKSRDGLPLEEYDAAALMDEIAKSAWECADPGVQFDGAIQAYNTAKSSGKIKGTNPCSEYVWHDNTSCNLASFNLLKFYDRKTKTFDYEMFGRAVRLLITAMDISVEMGSYPTPVIRGETLKYRTLGLGYANLGSLLMVQGYPYDSEEGRYVAAAITAYMTGMAYTQSQQLAARKGHFPELEVGDNRKSLADVIRRHMNSAAALANGNLPCASKSVSGYTEMASRAFDLLNAVHGGCSSVGVRNAQVTVIAPTGTIAFMMDCATTGVEPEIGLVKYKKLVGGGMMKLVNPNVEEALTTLGYTGEVQGKILDHIREHGTVEGCDLLDAQDLPVFDCSMATKSGTRTVHYRGHIKMLAVVQPFVSGSISKTVNLPNSTTVEEIKDVYVEAWKMGLKCIALYREGSKSVEPYSASDSTEVPRVKEEIRVVEKIVERPAVIRRRLPDDRRAVTHKFSISDAHSGGVYEGYITVGLFEDGSPGEVFLRVSKEGSTLSGLLDSFAIMLSMALQHGVPLEPIVRKFRDMRFSPNGSTHAKDPELRFCSSIVDYVVRYLELHFLRSPVVGEVNIQLPKKVLASAGKSVESGPPCSTCGAVTVRDGKCHVCPSCGTTVGACA